MRLHDIVTQAQAQSRSLTRGLGGEERLENLSLFYLISF